MIHVTKLFQRDDTVIMHEKSEYYMHQGCYRDEKGEKVAAYGIIQSVIKSTDEDWKRRFRYTVYWFNEKGIRVDSNIYRHIDLKLFHFNNEESLSVLKSEEKY